jgi:hypothetical protein
MGCFYYKPIVELNEPPDVVYPEGTSRGAPFDAPLSQSTRLQVVANDPDSEEVLCFWIVDGVESPTATCEHRKTAIFSLLELPYDEALECALAEAHVLDTESGEEAVAYFRLVLDAPCDEEAP